MHLVIIGNGVAGVTCALNARQREPEARITIVSEETPYFFSRTALMYAFMDRMTRRNLEPFERSVYEKQRIELRQDTVVDVDAGAHTITLKQGGSLAWDKLVFATGARPWAAPWPGLDQVREGRVHFVSMQDLDACERLVPSTQHAVVVGGGLIGIELVECLMHHRIPTTFMVREDWYWPIALCRDEATLVAAHMRTHGVDLRLKDELREVHSDANGRVSGVTFDSGHVACQMLGIAIGVRSAVEAFRKVTTPPEIRRGFVVNERFETSLPDVYAIGDCAEIQPAQGESFTELIWYSAKRQGALLGARALWGDAVQYQPPTFFNSSKFFEMEYTTVGSVVRLPASTPTIRLFDEKRGVSLRIVHDGGRVLGFNMLGSRWNHEVLVRWVDERRSAEFVVAHLRDAQFDVEFGRVPLAKLHREDRTLGEVNA